MNEKLQQFYEMVEDIDRRGMDRCRAHAPLDIECRPIVPIERLQHLRPLIEVPAQVAS